MSADRSLRPKKRQRQNPGSRAVGVGKAKCRPGNAPPLPRYADIALEAEIAAALKRRQPVATLFGY
ncbi:MAG: hypothetical protein COT92_00750 [Candidatus Doudnabacteria bacterium CG10_big_fil_rev_8_21_14_0_10_42_18]|uniref:Uncharacterized protein n=1 Tax=Candidatus Doudnabacteria bacterium CG10_big_fil_rev_8_21_14_0_10_42_18 TaxID=1974552 RepID=A0A2H0VDY6_9BACT|nr:MAG: hypothetical protein COT92_00750 [Candidatus Doudnabacteria bacterium CG10_big_fil_rev_8_21_14_0_10_42_18]